MFSRRNAPKAATRGVILSAAGTVYPKAWSVLGGGVALTFLRPENTFSIAAATGSDDDKVRLYFQGGFGF